MTSPGTSTTSYFAVRKPLHRQIDAYGLTHAGKVRETNQDHFMISSLQKRMEVHRTSIPNVEQLPLQGERLAYLGMVADGVGSGVGGGEASRLAVEVAAQYVAHSMQCYYSADAEDHDQFLIALQEAATKCHASVMSQAAEEDHAGSMATTLTLWIGIWPRAYLLQVGDSRCYLYRKGVLTQISRDQTIAQELVDEGVMSRTDAQRTQLAHVLSSSIGGSHSTPVVTRVDQSWGHVGLLCSDGLTKHVSEEQITDRLKNMKSAKQVCEDLLQDALDDGGTDNVTIVVGRAIRPPR